MTTSERRNKEHEVFMCVKHLHAQYSRLMDAAAAVVIGMRNTGRSARVVDYKSGEYITVRIDNKDDYRIFRTSGWHYYEILLIQKGV